MMFMSMFYYRLVLLLRDRSNIFFMLVFPIILILGLGLMLNDIMSPSSQLIAEPFAVVYETGADTVFAKEFTAFIERPEINQILNFTEYADEQQALWAYQNGTVSGIVNVSGDDTGLDIEVQTAEPGGMIGTIAGSLFSNFAATSNTIMQVYLNGGEVAPELMQDTYISSQSLAWQKKVPNAYEYYMVTNLVMTALFAAFYALDILEDNEISQGIGVRLRTTPIPMWLTILAQLSAAMVVIMVQLSIIAAFAHFVLGAYLGAHIGLVILLLFVTALLGLGIGAVFAAIRRLTMTARANIMRTLLILSTFLAGGYVAGIDTVLLQTVPFIRYVLPSLLAQNALFEMIFFEHVSIYWQNLGILAVMAAAMLAAGIALAGRRL